MIGGRYQQQDEKTAFDTLNNLPVVIQQIPADAVSFWQARQGFRHDNLVRVVDVVAEGDTHYVITELIQGHRLSTLIGEALPAIPLVQVLRCGLDLTGALAYLHGQSTPHGDIRPENVILQEDGKTYLAFGAVNTGATPEDDIQALAAVLMQMHPVDAVPPDLAALINRMMTGKSIALQVQMDLNRILRGSSDSESSRLVPLTEEDETEIMARPPEFRPPPDVTQNATDLSTVVTDEKLEFEPIPPPERPAPAMPDPGQVNIRNRFDFSSVDAGSSAAEPIPDKPASLVTEHERRVPVGVIILIVLALLAAAALANLLSDDGGSSEDNSSEPAGGITIVIHRDRVE